MKPRELDEVVENALTSYAPFDLRKSGSSKWRHIDNPTGALKDAQSRLYRSVLKELQFPPSMCGGVPGRSPRDGAARLVRAPTIVTLDIRSFFPSVNHEQVFAALREAGFGTGAARVMTRMTTHEGRLPQGSACSPILANLVLLPVVRELEEVAAALNLELSVYIDDVAFGGALAREAIEPAIVALRRGGFAISGAKTRVMSAAEPQTVLGMSVNRRLGAPKTYRDQLADDLFALNRNDAVAAGEMASLSGRIAHVGQLNSNHAKYFRLVEQRLQERVSGDVRVKGTKFEREACLGFDTGACRAPRVRRRSVPAQ